jgi:hypothetical protein
MCRNNLLTSQLVVLRLYHSFDYEANNLNTHLQSVYATNPDWEFPLGRFPWDVYGEPCYKDYHVVVPLSLNACNYSEFNCNNGFCISMSKRCDGKLDCPDKTGTNSSA